MRAGDENRIVHTARVDELRSDVPPDRFGNRVAHAFEDLTHMMIEVLLARIRRNDLCRSLVRFVFG
jgi:hypothetical protein